MILRYHWSGSSWEAVSVDARPSWSSGIPNNSTALSGLSAGVVRISSRTSESGLEKRSSASQWQPSVLAALISQNISLRRACRTDTCRTDMSLLRAAAPSAWKTWILSPPLSEMITRFLRASTHPLDARSAMRSKEGSVGQAAGLLHAGALYREPGGPGRFLDFAAVVHREPCVYAKLDLPRTSARRRTHLGESREACGRKPLCATWRAERSGRC